METYLLWLQSACCQASLSTLTMATENPRLSLLFIHHEYTLKNRKSRHHFSVNIPLETLKWKGLPLKITLTQDHSIRQNYSTRLFIPHRDKEIKLDSVIQHGYFLNHQEQTLKLKAGCWQAATQEIWGGISHWKFSGTAEGLLLTMWRVAQAA